MKLFILIISLASLSFSRDFDHNSNFHGWISIDTVYESTSPAYVLTLDDTAGVVHRSSFDSLTVAASDSAGVAGYSDSSGVADTALNTPDSVRAAWKADTAGKSDTARAAYVADTCLYYPDTVPYADTADFAHHSPATPHEVGIDTFAVAVTDTTFDGGNLYRNGDTTIVGVLSSEELTYSLEIAAASGNPYYLAENSSGDIIAAAHNNVIYKQTGGSGAFAAQGAPSLDDYTGVWYDIYDTLWVCTGDSGFGQAGAVFKSGDDGVTWDSLPWPDHNYSGGTCDTLGNILVCSYGTGPGKIFVKYTGVDTLDTLSVGTLPYRGMCCNNKTNDIYICVAKNWIYNQGAVHKMVGGIGSVSVQSGILGTYDCHNCAVDTFGNIYVTTTNYYQYKQQNGVGPFTPISNSNYGAYGFYGVTGKQNGDVAFVKYWNDLYILSAEDSKIAFLIESGKFQSDGANIFTHTIVDDSPDLIAGKNTVDNQIIYARPESLTVDSARAALKADTSYRQIFIGGEIEHYDDTISMTLSTSYQKDTIYHALGECNNAECDSANDIIILNYNGFYLAGFGAAGYVGTGGIDVRRALFLNETEIDGIHTHMRYRNASEFSDAARSGIIRVTDAPDTMTTRTRSSSGTPTINFTYSNMWATYQGN